MSEIVLCTYCSKPRPKTVSVCPYCKPPASAIFNNGIGKAAEKFAKVSDEMAARSDRKDRLESARLPPDLDQSCRYPSLAMISVIIKIVAVVPVILALIVLFFMPSPIGTKIAGVALTVVWAILVWAGSESIQIFIDMEENQRKIISALNKQPE